MANRSIFETMRARLNPLHDSHDVGEFLRRWELPLLEPSGIIFMKEHQS